ncbi:hypothetical protein ZEAMMB73_Zm00001d047747 [Zea mays]|uniref:Transmembrane protein n=1 Tax=Zea mays TaxID=4577 RepID=A0A1D6PCY3_MAIZE|nr:hypothetical protein ZEAMMB73_Zm00001d047747 [Zea mays]
MEGSLVTRLPEANSLPDGFVPDSESPGTDATFPFSAPIVDDALNSDIPAATNPGGEETLNDPPLPASSAEDASSAAAAEALGTLSLDAAAEPERALEENGPTGAARGEASLKNCASELVGAPTAQKGSVEPKRKVVKRSKLEKDRELFELAQQYHKVVAERDAVEFNECMPPFVIILCIFTDKTSSDAVVTFLWVLCAFALGASMAAVTSYLEVQEGAGHYVLFISLTLLFTFDLLCSALEGTSFNTTDFAASYAARLDGPSLFFIVLRFPEGVSVKLEEQRLKEKMMELELADLRLQQHQEKAAHEHTQMQLYAEQVSQLMTTEKNLRLQLASDGERFQHFQDALSKSNEVFETYKQEMEKMILVIKNLKKDNEFLKGKCENSDIALVKLIEERELTKKQIEKLKNQKETLESLCRSLQAERKQGRSASIPDAPSSQEDMPATSQES